MSIHFRGGFGLGAPTNIRKYPPRDKGKGDEGTREKTPEGEARDSWGTLFSKIGLQDIDPKLILAALKDAAETFKGGKVRSVEDPAGFAISVYLPGSATPDEIRTEFASRLMKLGLDIDRAMIGIGNVERRIGEAGGEIVERRFDVVIPASGYSLDKTGLFVASNTEAELTARVRKAEYDRDEALSKMIAPTRDRIIAELEERRATRLAAKQVEEAERHASEERSAREKVEKENADLRAKMGEIMARLEKVEILVPAEQLERIEQEEKAARRKVVKPSTVKEVKKAKKNSEPLKVEKKQTKKEQRIEAERIEEARRLRRNELARARRAELRELERIEESKRLRRNERARERRAEIAKTAKGVKSTVGTKGKKAARKPRK